jgi:hypothetical protein
VVGAGITAHPAPAAPAEDTVYFFASADRTAVPGVSFTQTVPMSSPLVGPGRMTLYVDPSGGVRATSDMPPRCSLEDGRMGFRCTRAPCDGAARSVNLAMATAGADA